MTAIIIAVVVVVVVAAAATTTTRIRIMSIQCFDVVGCLTECTFSLCNEPVATVQQFPKVNFWGTWPNLPK